MQEPDRVDAWTLGAISIVAYVTANVLHEGLGHGGMCLLLGGEPTALSTAYFDMVDDSVSPAGLKWVAAGGAIVNVIAGAVFWVLFQASGKRQSPLKYFWWLSMTVNLLVGTGYLLFSGVSQVGDWEVVIRGWQPFWAWNTGMTALGGITYLASVWLAVKTLVPLVGGRESISMTKARRLSLFPFLVGSVATTIGAVLNPLSPILIATSAAAHFGGTSGLGWMAQLYRGNRFRPSGEDGLHVPRSWTWIATASILLALHIFVLGPAIEF